MNLYNTSESLNPMADDKMFPACAEKFGGISVTMTNLTDRTNQILLCVSKIEEKLDTYNQATLVKIATLQADRKNDRDRIDGIVTEIDTIRGKQWWIYGKIMGLSAVIGILIWAIKTAFIGG